MTDILLSLGALLGFIALTAGTALFVAAEFSLTSLERSTVESHARAGDARARRVKKAYTSLSLQLSAAQVGITLTTLVTGFLAEPVLSRYLMPPLLAFGLTDAAAGTTSLVLALVIATSLSMIFGELAPKNAAITHPLETARVTAGAMLVFTAVFRGLITALNGTANRVLRLIGVQPVDELASARSPQELTALVRASAEEGSLDTSLAELLDRSLRFGTLSAEDLMTPRSTVEMLGLDDTVIDLIQAADRTGHSRFPVADGDLDNAVGVVHVKQAFTVSAGARATTTLARLATPVPTVPHSLDADALREQVRASGGQLAFVADEYGGIAGLVTIEDIVEEILGEVRDEHDRPELLAQRRGAGWVCSGLLRTDEVERATGYRAPDGEYETLGGLVMHVLGRIPVVDDRLLLPSPPESFLEELSGSGGDWSARVLSMDGRRVEAVLISPVTAARARELRDE